MTGPGDPGTLAQLISANRAGSAAIGRLRARIRHDRNLSAGYLGLGFTVLGGIVMLRGLVSLGWSWSDGPWRWLSLLAWALLGLTFVAAVVAARLSGGILPGRLSRLIVAVGLVAVGLDLAGFAFRSPGEQIYLTATIGFGGCLLACLPRQPLRRSVVGTIALAVGGGASLVLSWALDPESPSTGIVTLLLGLAPVVVGIALIRVSDAHLSRKIDQALTDSLVTAPAVGHGVLAASELRRLDQAAERLLVAVAATPPDRAIDRSVAASAGLLADELRLALMADHEQSWLQIAVTESEHLSGSVRIVDPAVLAARLEPEQRRTLLALVWLCVAAAPSTIPALDLTFIASTGDRPLESPPTIAFSLVGTHRRAIDPAVWPLFTRLGRHWIDLGPGRALVVVELPSSARR